MKRIGIFLALLALALAGFLAYRRWPPKPDFKDAVAVELYDCSPVDAECPGAGTLHFAIDAKKFREAVASAKYDGSFWLCMGAFLLRVTLPDGTVRDLKVFYGGGIVQQLYEHGSWIFPKEDTAFSNLVGDVHQNLVIPARIRRNLGVQGIDGGVSEAKEKVAAQQGVGPDGRSPAAPARRSTP